MLILSEDTVAEILRADREEREPVLPVGIRGFHYRVVGESFRNHDGTRRQDIIAGLRPGQDLDLAAEPDNPYDDEAVAVLARDGCIGYLPRGHDLANEVEDGRCAAIVASVRRGESGAAGVVIYLAVDERRPEESSRAVPPSRPRPPARPPPDLPEGNGKVLVWFVVAVIALGLLLSIVK